MRDPDGSVTFVGDRVVRNLNVALPDGHFLQTSTAAALVTEKKLVSYDLSDPGKIVSPRLPFVSHPSEWSNAQLFDAADLTLEIARRALDENHEIKDASAWNVIFDGARPLFCDHMSFTPIATRSWLAFGQFARQFLFPLVIARHRGLTTAEIFRFARDGLDPVRTRRMLGLARFATRIWPLTLGGDAKETDNSPLSTLAAISPGQPTYHARLISLLDWMLAGQRPRSAGNSAWSSYIQTRRHYSDEALQYKRDVVGRWLGRIAPKWAIDFGCNTGEFSAMAVEAGARVVSIDVDHDCIERLHVERRGDTRVHPVLARLDDMSGGLGWIGEEFTGLAARLEGLADVNLMLALLHHLTIAAAVPLDWVVDFACRTTRRWSIVEVLDSDDPLVRLLCAQRNRSPDEFSAERQIEAFSERFRIIEKIAVPQTRRFLLLMEVK